MARQEYSYLAIISAIVTDVFEALADPEQIAFLEAAGQDTASLERITFTEIVPVTRLAWVDRFDFAPDVEPYDIACAVTFEPVPGGTRMTLTSDWRTAPVFRRHGHIPLE